MQCRHKLESSPTENCENYSNKWWLLAPAGKLTILYFTQQDAKHRVQDAESKQKKIFRLKTTGYKVQNTDYRVKIKKQIVHNTKYSV